MNEDEVIIGDDGDDSDDCTASSQETESNLISNDQLIQFKKQIDLCSFYFPYLNIKYEGNKVDFQIPSNVLPLSTQMVCGFTVDPILLDVSFTINKKYEWDQPVECYSCKHPIYNQSYYGRSLVLDTIRHFFTKLYMPKSNFRSCIYAFHPNGEADSILLKFLIDQGFDPKLAERALIINRNDINKSQDLLLSNQMPLDINYVPISFVDSPFVFLVLEIIECFIDLNDHCCICRKVLPFPGIRPNICNSQLCSVSFNEIGVGTSVLQEIKRDALAADFIISVFTGSFVNRKYMSPRPPKYIEDAMNDVVANLPSMNQICTQCMNDTDISKKYGADSLNFLRWVLLSNRSQVISLSGKQRIKELPTNYQFMTLIASPEVEYNFSLKKNRYGSDFMWHGSGGERWHSILRNGLKNMSKIPGEAIHGAAHGQGIYFAKDSGYSCSYSAPVPLINMYKNSVIGSKFNILALCEVARVKTLKDHGVCYTLTDESACIVRLMVPFLYTFSIQNKIKHIPSLEDVIKIQTEKAKTKENKNVIEIC
ncbi:Poly [ADP-ribose] polymerase 6 [Tritrichomonas musculus]|uniref:Poly [ADP-ribose] polymerase 6 n=1 Tax=Tritrichomonas musculus TaxID=1915356 RepID=A0ABR2IR12_9EUKA